MTGDSNAIDRFSEQEFSALTGPFKNLDFWMMGFCLFLEWFLVFVSSVVCMRYITEIFKEAFLANASSGFILKCRYTYLSNRSQDCFHLCPVGGFFNFGFGFLGFFLGSFG